jgi:hypothetical protein
MSLTWSQFRDCVEQWLAEQELSTDTEVGWIDVDLDAEADDPGARIHRRGGRLFIDWPSA